MCKYSVVIPAYNEETNIRPIYDRLLAVMESLEESWELIFVNDGSADGTLEELVTLAKVDHRVKFLNLTRNFGHQAALSAGLAHALGQAVISMDCDLQDPPDLIIEMIEKWKKGFAIVYAQRLNFRKDNFLKRAGTKLYYRILNKFSQVDIPQNIGDFRLLDRRVLDILNNMEEGSPLPSRDGRLDRF